MRSIADSLRFNSGSNVIQNGDQFGTPQGIETAVLALRQDPDPDVRLQAVFALTASAAVARGRSAIERALDDPAIAQDPGRLSALVLTLENLAQHELVNDIDQLGRRLRACPLSPDARQRLDELLARVLPRGGR